MSTKEKVKLTIQYYHNYAPEVVVTLEGITIDLDGNLKRELKVEKRARKYRIALDILSAKRPDAKYALVITRDDMTKPDNVVFEYPKRKDSKQELGKERAPVGKDGKASLDSKFLVD